MIRLRIGAASCRAGLYLPDVCQFDEYVMVDWSASDRPRLGQDSIWICRAVRGHGSAAAEVGESVNSPTRSGAEVELRGGLTRSLAAGRRVLVGFDFPLALSLGYVSSCSVLEGLSGTLPPWLVWWEWLTRELNDDEGGEANRSNRFAVADRLNRESGTRYFWGRPGTERYESLDHLPTRDVPVAGLRANPCERLRLCERLASGHIKSAWQLFGGVTVGSQMLTGIPRVAALRDSFDQATVAIWPFEPDEVEAAQVVVAEIWPTLFAAGPGARSELARAGAVRDEVQVTQTVRACAAADERGDLGRWLAPASEACTPELLGEEGWILGVQP